MASNIPTFVFPQTPSPDPDDKQDNTGLGLHGFQNSPTKSTFDPSALSPMDENFPMGRRGPAQALVGTPSNPLSPTDTNSQYSPMSLGTLDSSGSYNSAVSEVDKGVFNFQPASLAKSPVSKSVSRPSQRGSTGRDANSMLGRVLVKEEAINTNTVAFPTSSFSNPLHAPLWLFQIPFQFPRSKNAGEVCRGNKIPASGGASAIWPSQPILSQALKAL